MNLNISVEIFNKNRTIKYNIYSNQIFKLNCQKSVFGFTSGIEFILFNSAISDDFLEIFYNQEQIFINYIINETVYYKGFISKKELLQITNNFRKYRFIIDDIAKGLWSNLYIQNIYKEESITNIINQNISGLFELNIDSGFFNLTQDIINIHSLSFYDFLIYLCDLYKHYFLYCYDSGKYEITDSLDFNLIKENLISQEEMLSFSQCFKRDNKLTLYFNSDNRHFDVNTKLLLDYASLDLENNQKYIKKLCSSNCEYEITSLNKNSEYNYENNFNSLFNITGYKYYIEYADKIKTLLPEYNSKAYSLDIIGEVNIGDEKQELKKYNLIEKEDGVYCSVTIPEYNIAIPAKFNSNLNSNFGFIPPYNKQKVKVKLNLFSAEIISYLDFRLNNKLNFESCNNILDLGFSNDITANISSSLANEKSILKISQGSKDIKNLIEMTEEGLNISLEYEQ